MILQKSLLRHLVKEYSALVSAIKTSWTEESTNLAETILQIIYYAEIIKRNIEDSVENTKVLVTRTLQVPKRTCITQKCIDKEVTTHFPDRY